MIKNEKLGYIIGAFSMIAMVAVLIGLPKQISPKEEAVIDMYLELEDLEQSAGVGAKSIPVNGACRCTVAEKICTPRHMTCVSKSYTEVVDCEDTKTPSGDPDCKEITKVHDSHVCVRKIGEELKSCKGTFADITMGVFCERIDGRCKVRQGLKRIYCNTLWSDPGWDGITVAAGADYPCRRCKSETECNSKQCTIERTLSDTRGLISSGAPCRVMRNEYKACNWSDGLPVLGEDAK
jgi:hypothetical protein